MQNMIPRIFKNELLIEIESETPERFLNLCAQNDIQITNIRHTSKGIHGSFQGMCEQKVRLLAEKADINIRIERRKGIAFRVLVYRLRIAFFLMPILMCAYLFHATGYIWRITIEGNHQVTDEQMLEYLEDCSCGYGTLIKEINLVDLEFLLREQFKEIIWVNVIIEGTCLKIEVKENDTLEYQLPSENQQGYSIYSEKNGQIISMIVRQGVPLCKIGDTVEAGSELVSGSVPIYNSSDPTQIIAYKQVTADADIKILTTVNSFWYEPKVKSYRIPYAFREHTLYLCIDNNFMMIPYKRTSETIDGIVSCYQLSILDNFYLPIFYGQLNTFILNPVLEFQDEGKRKAELQLAYEEYQNELELRGIEIVSKDFHYLYENDGTYLFSALQVIMPCTTRIENESNIEGNIDEPRDEL